MTSFQKTSLLHSAEQSSRRRVQLTFLVSRVTGEGGGMRRRRGAAATLHGLQAMQQAQELSAAAAPSPAHYSLH